VVPIRTRALVFGASGQVGNALQQTVPATASLIAHDSATTNVCDRDEVARAIRDAQPNVLINCAAFTNVDAAETRTDDALLANGVAPGVIAELATLAGARVIHLSTDYVFDGQAHSPYLPEAAASPLNAYGATKLEGERRVLAAACESVIVRTAWVHSGGGTNFIRTAVRLLTAGTPMRVVDDQIGTPTRAAHLADALWRIAAQTDIRGVLHFTDAGVASWYDVAVVVHETLRSAGRLGRGAGVSAARSEDFPRPARRPQFSVLDKHASWDRIGVLPPHWAEGVIASTMELVNA
jgi:dTDP-4-dehydrorhamnose reductase